MQPSPEICPEWHLFMVPPPYPHIRVTAHVIPSFLLTSPASPAPVGRMLGGKLPCHSLSPRVCSNSCPLSWWCHPTTSSSDAPSPPTFSLSQHQGLFQWVGSSHQVAKGLELQLQHQSFLWIFRTDFLSDGLVWSPCSLISIILKES